MSVDVVGVGDARELCACALTAAPAATGNHIHRPSTWHLTNSIADDLLLISIERKQFDASLSDVP